jgi:hypothetical protein
MEALASISTGFAESFAVPAHEHAQLAPEATQLRLGDFP